MDKDKEPEYPSIYDPRSGTGSYYPWDDEYKEKMKIWKKWQESQQNKHKTKKIEP